MIMITIAIIIIKLDVKIYCKRGITNKVCVLENIRIEDIEESIINNPNETN